MRNFSVDEASDMCNNHEIAMLDAATDKCIVTRCDWHTESISNRKAWINGYFYIRDGNDEVLAPLVAATTIIHRLSLYLIIIRVNEALIDELL